MTSSQTPAAGPGNYAGPSSFRAPQPKPGVRVVPPSFLRRLRRSIGGTIAYLASWWRY